MATILFASDHAGFELKEKLKIFVQGLGYAVEDAGAATYDQNDDYTDFIHPAAAKVSADPTLRGIFLGGSGEGEAIVANRYPHVRAVVFYGGAEKVIRFSREHNNANVLSLGAWYLTDEEAEEAVKLWLETPFGEEERHARRVGKIDRHG